MIMDCVNDLLAQTGLERHDIELHDRRQLRLPVRHAVRVRAEHRRRRRVAAGLREPRRDGRRVGAVRGLAAPAARRHRHRARHRLGQVVAGHAARRLPAADRSLRDRRRSASTPCRWRASRPERSSTPARPARRDFAEVVVAQPPRRARQPVRAGQGRRRRADELLDEPYYASPLRKHDLPPISDGAAAMHHRPRRPCARAHQEPGLDPRHRSPHRVAPPGPARPHRLRCPPSVAAKKLGVHDGPIDVAELTVDYSPEEIILREALGLGGDANVNPSGGPLCGHPVMATGLVRVIEVAQRITDGEAQPRRRPRVERCGAAAEPALRAGRRASDGASCAVIGIGQTQVQAAPRRPLARRPRARGGAARARGRRAHVQGHRRDRASARRPTRSKA